MDRQNKLTNSKQLAGIPLGMGMIQPEWFYMSHFFAEKAEEKAAQKRSTPLVPPTTTPPSGIQIHFRSRK